MMTTAVNMKLIGFNKPHFTGRETEYIIKAVKAGKISGDGIYTKKCHTFFEQGYKFKKALLTTSCTDALEMASILIDIKPGDEVIVPSFTFVSTANAFALRGAKIVFADSCSTHPNMDINILEPLITSRTKAIVVVHYAGVANDMDAVMSLAQKHKLYVVEDAAQAIDAYYKDKALGSIGHLGAFSFHETKNIISGEGGMLTINDDQFIKRAEIIREKGTNRSAFFRGEIDKYSWVDIGSSFLPSDMIAAFLYAQLENLEDIQQKRIAIWNTYQSRLQELSSKGVMLPYIPDYASNNAHMFYLVCKNLEDRTNLIEHLKNKKINVVFHYLSLHKSIYFEKKHDGRVLPNADRYSDCLVRLPLFYDLQEEEVHRICDEVMAFYK